jgi:glycosyltransferase involved in cell wall biosynthesis
MLMRLYRTERPDIVHHVALKPIVCGTLAAWLAGVPRLVNAVSGLGWMFSSSNRFMRLARPMARAILVWLLKRQHSVTIVQNVDDRAVLANDRLMESRLRLVPGAGVDTKVYRPTPEPPGLVCIVLVARMLWDKGVAQFVEAARLLTEAAVPARFVLVGEPDAGNPSSVPIETLRQWSGKHGVEWWGRCNNMPAVYQNAHIACLPSYYGEGVPKALLEAAACGLPIVTTDAPGCRDVVRDGDNGLLVPVRDAISLAKALRTLIEDKDLRAKMGQRGRQIVVEHFSQDRVIAETLAVYHELMQ